MCFIFEGHGGRKNKKDVDKSLHVKPLERQKEGKA
jgi:hypothetical protein